MRKKDAIKHYGSQSAVAAELGITRQAVHQWPKIVPLAAAVALSEVSKGKVKLRLEDYR